MGACFSSKSKAADAVRRSPAREPSPESESSQEEKVKEVLSETPKPRVVMRTDDQVKKEEEIEIGFEITKKGEADLSSINGCDEKSEDASEVYSVSESLSVSTSVTDNKRVEDEVEVEGKRKMERSPSKIQRKRSGSGDLQAAKERGAVVGCRRGRSSPSPARRTSGDIVRMHSAAEAGHAPRNRVPSSNGFRRDPGERSGRRSVSPAMKRAGEQRGNVGSSVHHSRSLSSSRVNDRWSPRRMPARESDDGGRRVLNASTVGDGSLEAKESLENPLVSLECFIFL